ncbi:MAG TPA: hypothetical protein VFB84_16640 [Micromonosporaceae bacterium]|nr:hypothetical protein [Micromonosporaceae bacterium]
MANNPTASPSAVKTALQSAGNLGWSTATDPDTTDDILLNVATF